MLKRLVPLTSLSFIGHLCVVLTDQRSAPPCVKTALHNTQQITVWEKTPTGFVYFLPPIATEEKSRPQADTLLLQRRRKQSRHALSERLFTRSFQNLYFFLFIWYMVELFEERFCHCTEGAVTKGFPVAYSPENQKLPGILFLLGPVLKVMFNK